MYERLLEGWLDSASERSYQGPFCQILSARGYTVLHSTRHAPIEFGKDVIAIAPDGVPCAYPPDKTEKAVETVIKQAELLAVDWAA